MKKLLKNREAFVELASAELADQTEFFLKSFIFVLGDQGFKDVDSIAEKYSNSLKTNHEATDLSPIQAADFLQKNGKTRTAAERTAEMKVCLKVDLLFSNSRTHCRGYRTQFCTVHNFSPRYKELLFNCTFLSLGG
jgi:hypothetical protein